MTKKNPKKALDIRPGIEYTIITKGKKNPNKTRKGKNMEKTYKVMVDESMGAFDCPYVVNWTQKDLDEKINFCNTHGYGFTLEPNKYGADIYMAISAPACLRLTFKEKIKNFFKRA